MQKWISGWLLLGLGIVALFALGWLNRPVSALTSEITATKDLIARGEYLAKAGDCIACHTEKNGRAFAGGLPMPIPYLGNIYSRNITPDKQTGIGNWSLAEFDRAVRYGISQDGRNLYPAMPYVSFAKITDEDMKALYIYFQYGVTAVEQANKPSTIAWPWNMRWPLQYWNWLFLPLKPYQPVAQQNEVWNRGAYLVQGLAHCGTCHTPRGLLMQEQALNERGAGYLAGAVLNGWQAYNITSATPAGIGHWTQEQLVQYLRTGSVARLAQAAGPMSDAVLHSFSQLTEADINAIATYIRSIPPVNNTAVSRFTQGKPAEVDVALRSTAVSAELNPQRLFLGACASCHQLSGTGSSDGYFPSLTHNSTVGAEQATNLIQVILKGIERDKVLMPAFEQILTDEQIAALATFLVQQFGNPTLPTVTPEQVAELRKLD